MENGLGAWLGIRRLVHEIAWVQLVSSNEHLPLNMQMSHLFCMVVVISDIFKFMV